MKDFTEKEMEIVTEHALRVTQLHNINAVMRSSMPPHKAKAFEKDILPGYITREFNTRAKAEKIMRKKGYQLR